MHTGQVCEPDFSQSIGFGVISQSDKISFDLAFKFFFVVSACKNQSKWQKTALLLVEIQILIDFLTLTLREKEAFKLGTSLT